MLLYRTGSRLMRTPRKGILAVVSRGKCAPMRLTRSNGIELGEKLENSTFYYVNTRLTKSFLTETIDE